MRGRNRVGLASLISRATASLSRPYSRRPLRASRRARARSEVDEVRLHPTGGGRGRHRVDVDVSGEPGVGPFDGLEPTPRDLHVTRTYPRASTAATPQVNNHAGSSQLVLPRFKSP